MSAQNIFVKGFESGELGDLLCMASVFGADAQISQALKARFETLDRLVKFRQIDGDFSSASGTRELRVAFEPSDAFSEFMAAVAGEIDPLVVEQSIHLCWPSIGKFIKPLV